MNSSQLRVFLDRSIGTKKIALALRGLGLDVQTIRDRYGDESSRVADVQWIADATNDGRLLFGADQRIRYNPLERRALCIHSARCFTFPRGNLTANQMIDRLVANLAAIAAAAVRTGPYVYHLLETRITQMALDCSDVDSSPQ
jgi:hypothetical protein